MSILHTKRLELRPIVLKDAPYILKQLNDPGWLKYIGDRNVHSIKDAENYIKTKIFVTVEKNDGVFFVVALKDASETDESIIGQCGLFRRDGLDYHDIGFSFLENYCGNGYGYEAATAVLDYSIKKGNKKIVAITSDDNLPSQALLKKLGMTYTKDVILPKIDGNNRYFEFLESPITQ